MAIRTVDKNLLLLPVTDGGVTQKFNMPGFSGYDSTKAKHNGLDLGWTKTQYCDILACQDGKVVQLVNNSSCGYGIVLQHDYEDGTHRWTGYIHLKSAACDKDNKSFKVGQTVKQGDKLGIRGGSPYVNGKAKYGVHLHLYVTNANKLTYSWNTMKANVIDPYPLLYKSKAVKYNALATSEGAMMNPLKYLEDVTIKVVSPVERDATKDQLVESSSNLRVRTAPSLSGSIIGYLKANAYYDYFDSKIADGYTWYKIAEEQWCAKTSTMTVYPGKTEIEILKEEIEKLNKALAETGSELEKSLEANKKLAEEVKSKEEENKTLEDQNITLVKTNSELTSTNDTLTTKIIDATEILKL